LLAAGNRFLDGALFHGDWVSPGQYALDAAVIIGIALFAYRVTVARQMVTQYPWLYEKSSLMTWRARDGREGDAGQG
jgi:hypothetical protein